MSAKGGDADKAKEPLTRPAEWGRFDDAITAPIDVTGDSTWLAVILAWLTLPLVLIQALLSVCQCFYRYYAYSFMYSLSKGRPFYLAYLWWRYSLGGLFMLLARGGSRLMLFRWQREAWGGDHFWHGEGIWSCTYTEVDQVMRSEQPRVPAFGCIRSVSPDLFPSALLIFLPNVGSDSEWAAKRRLLHQVFLDQGGANWQERVALLPKKLAADWPNPKVADLDDVYFCRRVVSKCIFFMLLGIWVTDEEAKVLEGWRGNAFFFILPRFLQRFLFNLGIKKVIKLRRETVALVEKYGLQDVFIKFNQELPAKYRRSTAVQLCDELMYAIGFAGIGGTSACVESVAQFLQGKLPHENLKDRINLQRYSTPEAMAAAYKANPVAYIKESCRLSPPVTSACSPLAEDTTVKMAGRDMTFPKGTLRQYALSLANRDPAVFQDPDVFEPKRDNLNMALTWNGAFGTPGDEQNYPRICPGRYLALEVAKLVVDRAVGTAAVSP